MLTAAESARARRAWDVWSESRTIANAPNETIAAMITERVAAVIRAEREDALNEAARIADEYDNEEGHPSPQARALIRIVAERIRALASPAAAPAAEPRLDNLANESPSEPVAPADLIALLREAARRTPDLDFAARIAKALADGGEG